MRKDLERALTVDDYLVREGILRGDKPETFFVYVN